VHPAWSTRRAVVHRGFLKTSFETLHLVSESGFVSRMPKLSQIIEPFSDALWFNEKSVNVLAMILRKHGMITKAGRGSAGAEMGASDATNLMLAVLAVSASSQVEVTNIHHGVRFIRAAQLKARYHGKSKLKKRDKVPLSVDGLEGDLGRTLDAVFDALIRKDLPVEAISFELDLPKTGAMRAIIWLHPKTEDEDAEAWSLDFGRFMDPNHDARPGLQVVVRLRDWVIQRIADVIRGDVVAVTAAA
jgi:hypothetical protein